MADLFSPETAMIAVSAFGGLAIALGMLGAFWLISLWLTPSGTTSKSQYLVERSGPQRRESEKPAQPDPGRDMATGEPLMPHESCLLTRRSASGIPLLLTVTNRTASQIQQNGMQAVASDLLQYTNHMMATGEKVTLKSVRGAMQFSPQRWYHELLNSTDFSFNTVKQLKAPAVTTAEAKKIVQSASSSDTETIDDTLIEYIFEEED